MKIAIGLAVTAGLLWLLARGLDFEALGHAFSRLSIPIVVLALTFLAAGYLVRILRWWWMLRVLEPSLPVRACFWPFLTSIAVNNILPFRAGDALRVFGFHHQLRSPAARVLGTLVIERLLDLVVLLGFFFLGLYWLSEGVFTEAFVVVAIWLAGFSIVLILALILLTPWLGNVVHRLAARKFIANRIWSEAVLKQGAYLVEALALVRSFSRLLGLMGLSIITWVFEGAVYATVAVAVRADAAPFGPWFALATGTLATLIPSSPAYVGTFDFFAAEGLVAYGASQEVAVAFALTVHAVLWAPLTASGLLYLILHGKRFWVDQSRSAPIPEKE